MYVFGDNIYKYDVFSFVCNSRELFILRDEGLAISVFIHSWHTEQFQKFNVSCAVNHVFTGIAEHQSAIRIPHIGLWQIIWHQMRDHFDTEVKSKTWEWMTHFTRYRYIT